MVASIIISKSERDETLNHQHRRLIDASTPISQGGSVVPQSFVATLARGARRAPL